MSKGTNHYLVDGVGLWADIRGDSPTEPGPVLFLDRDGVLIEDRGYVGMAADTRLYPDVGPAVAAARALGYRVAIVTNQSGIARGFYDWAGFAAVQGEIDAALGWAGTALDAVFACAYHAQGASPYAVADHPWRKPRPGMLLEGLRRLNGVAARSALVGDRPSDIAAARAAGLGTAVLVDRGSPLSVAAMFDSNVVVGSLNDAIKSIKRFAAPIRPIPSLSLAGVIIPQRRTAEGVLIESTSFVWLDILRRLKYDWSQAYEIPPDKWEELVAGAYKKAGFDKVVLTPRSGDHGRDVIAVRNGIGCIKIIGSVKAYKPGHLVKYDDVRALLGVLSGEQDASKGIITTTSDFPPKITSDPFIAPFLPTRLELMNGARLRKWLTDLFDKSKDEDGT
jgi:restriction system protein